MRPPTAVLPRGIATDRLCQNSPSLQGAPSCPALMYMLDLTLDGAKGEACSYAATSVGDRVSALSGPAVLLHSSLFLTAQISTFRALPADPLCV